VTARDPVITGVGIVAAPGSNVEEIWRAFANGTSGLSPLSLFSSPRYGQVPVGEIQRDLVELGAPLRASRSDRLGWLAARDAVKAKGYPPSSFGAFVLGGTLGSRL